MSPGARRDVTLHPNEPSSSTEQRFCSPTASTPPSRDGTSRPAREPAEVERAVCVDAPAAHLAGDVRLRFQQPQRARRRDPAGSGRRRSSRRRRRRETRHGRSEGARDVRAGSASTGPGAAKSVAAGRSAARSAGCSRAASGASQADEPIPEVKPEVKAEAKVDVPKVEAIAPTPGTGGGTGRDGTTGDGPGAGGGVGSGIGTGRGSGIGPGTGGGSQANYPPSPTELFIPPLPMPDKVRGFHLDRRV